MTEQARRELIEWLGLIYNCGCGCCESCNLDDFTTANDIRLMTDKMVGEGIHGQFQNFLQRNSDFYSQYTLECTAGWIWLSVKEQCELIHSFLKEVGEIK